MRWKFSLVVLVFIMTACSTNRPPESPIGPTGTPVSPLPDTPTPSIITAPVVSSPGIISLRMFNELEGWGIAEDAIVRTNTGGQVWHNVSPTGITEFGFNAHGFFRNSQRAWLLVPDDDASLGGGRLYLTTDGGLTWESNAVPFRDGHLTFVSDRNGWVMAGLGAGAGSMAIAVFKTDNGGLTWEQVFTNDPNLEGSSESLPLGGIKMSLTPLNSQTAWIGGVTYAPGTFYFYRTIDGGATWAQQNLSLAPGIDTGEIAISQGPTFFSPTEAILPVRLTGENIQTAIYHTKNGGETWEYISAQPGAGMVDFVSPTEGVFWTGEQFFSTFDGGVTWSGIQPDILFGDSFIGMEFVTVRTGWVWTYEPTGARHLYKTSDGGATWTPFED
jgi:photosystem II stability/assembly factor-like uncharacterized protein